MQRPPLTVKRLLLLTMLLAVSFGSLRLLLVCGVSDEKTAIRLGTAFALSFGMALGVPFDRPAKGAIYFFLFMLVALSLVVLLCAPGGQE